MAQHPPVPWVKMGGGDKERPAGEVAAGEVAAGLFQEAESWEHFRQKCAGWRVRLIKGTQV